jgi:hypothetical protein
VTCIIAHSAGYSEENSLSAPFDPSGNKNPLQAIGSAQTYLQRYTLKAALGLAAAKDDDARSVSTQSDNTDDTGEIISPKQVQTLLAALKVREMPKERLLNWVMAGGADRVKRPDVTELGLIPVHIFQVCLDKVRLAGDPQ